MLKRTVNYINPFTDEPVVEDLYFNINLAEAVRLEMYDNLSDQLKDITELDMTDSANKKRIYGFFELIVEKSWGVRSEDGINFHKDPEATKRFLTSEAYSAVLSWLLLEDGAEENAASFINNLFPPTLMDKAKTLADEEAKKGTASA